MDTTSRALRRTAAGAASLLAVALLAACGGSDDKDASGPKGEKGKGSSASGGSASGGGDASGGADGSGGSDGKTLSAAELETAVVKDGEVPGHKISERAKVDRTAEKDVKTERAECGPLANAALGTTTGGPAAKVEREALTKPAKGEVKDPKDLESAFDATKSMISLAAYEDGGARSAMEALRKGVAPCGGGFTTHAHGEDLKITSVKEDTAPKLGDEATAFTVVNQQGHDKASFKVVVVRKGNTLAYFTSLNLGAIVSGKDFDFPVELAQAQAKKLA
ncbi:hypothetical protein HUT18_26070 [Streptomyces sp. NA04227]|uniref:hypothetical protein n=1 Tax=Streptomyces sp. NA04227 TaxID=2742136 RepID=UPI0015904989|nr:hypothetical protein [Streptomyces sp. NA04227]QKW09335.1 hypothetical protein HUT18_26070 [Streptomyces sp. NA04227]